MKSKFNNVGLMLNSCDAYSDLWENFFSQLKLNFPVVKEMNVYINSESIDFFDNDMKVINVHPSQKHPWSDRLRYCVSKITEEFVISIPEECIIESVVALDQFNQALEILNNDLNTAVVQLVKIPGKKTKNKIGPFIQREYDFRNLISQQASIWRTSKYYEYIKLNETPWEYEVLSSARGPIGNDTFYCIDDNEKEVFDYNYGVLVTRGYWAKEELERIEEKLSISFNRNARPVLTLDEINQKINKYSMFYWKLRYKKYKILLHKMIKSR